MSFLIILSSYKLEFGRHNSNILRKHFFLHLREKFWFVLVWILLLCMLAQFLLLINKETQMQVHN